MIDANDSGVECGVNLPPAINSCLLDATAIGYWYLTTSGELFEKSTYAVECMSAVRRFALSDANAFQRNRTSMPHDYAREPIVCPAFVRDSGKRAHR
ncbi:hypothetical protein RI103_31275 [Paraburkholderia sp. FT54]|uniref:hypothetical protein n=1 Tax=Paraburkholderia sp. FT54 TaxID=3074437 RepID=UPI002877558A|nr:hypothetical protein [Paraburkholderia sp. FT54]WNC92703.1 hypothetical protein RI103_31275 [Paraburkholderia sp. FT54]